MGMLEMETVLAVVLADIVEILVGFQLFVLLFLVDIMVDVNMGEVLLG